MSAFRDGLAVVGLPVAAGWVMGLAVAASMGAGNPAPVAETPEPLAPHTEAPSVSERIPVVATVYWAVASQTDDSPLITADGSRVNPAGVAAGTVRWCAVSRDLLSRWGGPLDYGDVVLVSGCGELDGPWEVRDTMNRRFGATAPTWDNGVKGVVEPHALEPVPVDGYSHIDLLVPEGTLGKWPNAEIRLE